MRTTPPTFNIMIPALYLTLGGIVTLGSWFLALDDSTALALCSIGAFAGPAALSYLSERLRARPRPLLWALSPIAGQSWGVAFAVQLVMDAHAPRLSSVAVMAAVGYGILGTALLLTPLVAATPLRASKVTAGSGSYDH